MASKDLSKTASPGFIPSPTAQARITFAPSVIVIKDRNYFRGSEVAPYLRDDSKLLVILTGWGTKRYWGIPFAHAEVIWLRPELVCIDLRWGGKRFGGRQNYYFLFDTGMGTWKRLTGRSPIVRLALDGSFGPGLQPSPTQTPMSSDVELA